MQTMTKNPLASASTLGIHSGAYFFVVACAIFFPRSSGNHPLLLAFGGGLVAALLVWSLVGKTLDPVRVALTGMIVSLLFASFTAALQLLFANEVAGLFLWGSGTLLQLDWSGVQFAWPWIGIVLLILLSTSRKLDVLLLNEEAAIGIGEKVGRIKLVGWLAAIFLAALTVAVVGPIGFVGIIAPHIVRLLGFRFTFNNYSWQYCCGGIATCKCGYIGKGNFPDNRTTCWRNDCPHRWSLDCVFSDQIESFSTGEIRSSKRSRFTSKKGIGLRSPFCHRHLYVLSEFTLWRHWIYAPASIGPGACA